MDKIYLANPPKPLNNYIDKRIKARQVKLQRELKNTNHLTCLGDAINQKSFPTRNGTSSKKVRFKPSTSATVSSKKKNKKMNRGTEAAPLDQEPKDTTKKVNLQVKEGQVRLPMRTQEKGKSSSTARR